MSWQHVESGKVNELPLELYQDGDDFMIRVDGLELMNSRWHRSEKELARVAGWCANNVNPRILIGGLGLGFTLHAFMVEFGNYGELVIAEKSADVVRWYNQYFKSKFFGLSGGAAQIINADVQDVLQSAGPFDLIVLDVDNGPEPVSGKSNETLYTVEGLKRIRSHLRPKGSLLLWSAFESDHFLTNAKEAGFQMSVWSVKVGHRHHRHFIYVGHSSGERMVGNHEYLQAACYDGYASDYDDDVDFIGRWLGEAKSILEVGVGTGRLALRFAPHRDLYVGIDQSAPMLHQLRKKDAANLVKGYQAKMFDFDLRQRFERVFFPFRVLPYAHGEDDVRAALKCAKNHLCENGRLLINMLDFTPEFVSRWDYQSVASSFTGPDGELWTKTDFMRFQNHRMYRRVQFQRDGQVMCESEDDLLWMDAARLSGLCEEVGLAVAHLWPAYSWSSYSGRDEYVLEARIK